MSHEIAAEPDLPEVDRRAVAHQDVGGGAFHRKPVTQIGAGERLVVGGILDKLLALDSALAFFPIRVQDGMGAVKAGTGYDAARGGVQGVEKDAADRHRPEAVRLKS